MPTTCNFQNSISCFHLSFYLHCSQAGIYLYSLWIQGFAPTLNTCEDKIQLRCTYFYETFLSGHWDFCVPSSLEPTWYLPPPRANILQDH